MDCGHGCCIPVACEMDGWVSKPDCRSGTRRNRWIAFRSRNPRYNRAGDPAACAVLRCQCRLPQRRAEDGTSTPGSIESEATTQLSLCRSPFKDALQHIPLRGGGGAPPYEGTPVTLGRTPNYSGQPAVPPSTNPLPPSMSSARRSLSPRVLPCHSP